MTARRGYALSDYGKVTVVYLDERTAREAAGTLNVDYEAERVRRPGARIRCQVILHEGTANQHAVFFDAVEPLERFTVAEVWFIPTEDGGAIVPTMIERVNVVKEKS